MKRRLDAQRELAALDAKDTLSPAEQKRADELANIIGDEVTHHLMPRMSFSDRETRTNHLELPVS
jgi:hypothetical protein